MANRKHFGEYIGAMEKQVDFTNVPIVSTNIDFHFFVAFAVDYTFESPPAPTNGQFRKFWDTVRLAPDAIYSIKQQNSYVKFFLSLGGASVNGPEGETTSNVFFQANTIDSWVENAVNTLTPIIQEYHIDGIDIDYENFKNEVDTNTFAECIGRLIETLKAGDTPTISLASIAPYKDPVVHAMYGALWARYSQYIDYVNFQLYALSDKTNVAEYLENYNEQIKNYDSDKFIPGFTTGIGPNVVTY